MSGHRRIRPGSAEEEKASRLETRVQEVTQRIQRAAFTGKGDKPNVIRLYRDYVGRIATALQKTLTGSGLAGSEGLEQPAELPPVPLVSGLPSEGASPLRLAEGQLLLVLGDRNARRTGGEGPTQVGVVAANSSSVSSPFAAADTANSGLSFDGMSHVVLPWQPPADGWAKAMLADVATLRSAMERVHQLQYEVRQLDPFQAESANIDQLNQFKAEASSLLEMVEACSSFRAFVPELRRAFDCNSEFEYASGQWLASFENLIDADRLAAQALRATKAVGARCYAAGQWLSVRDDGGEWVDVAVDASGAVRLDAEVALLHPWNHAPCELPQQAFETLHTWWVAALKVRHSHIFDALSGKRLNVLEQCVPINFVGGHAAAASGNAAAPASAPASAPAAGGNAAAAGGGDEGGAQSGADATDAELSAVKDAFSLADWLTTSHARCAREGGPVDRPAAVLLTGPPAAGKTSLMSQVLMRALQTAELVPILIQVQVLQRQLHAAREAFADAWNWVDASLYHEHHATQPALYRMFRQALMARRALVLLDGLDEGGDLRDEVERHVAEVLAPQGHVMLVTSRPTGLDKATRFAGFRQLELAPLTDEQQQQAIIQRVGKDQAPPLLAYVSERVQLDTETKLRISSNPLMLSMITSIFELRQGERSAPRERSHAGMRSADALCRCLLPPVRRHRHARDDHRAVRERIGGNARARRGRVTRGPPLDQADLPRGARSAAA